MCPISFSASYSGEVHFRSGCYERSTRWWEMKQWAMNIWANSSSLEAPWGDLHFHQKIEVFFVSHGVCIYIYIWIIIYDILIFIIMYIYIYIYIYIYTRNAWVRNAWVLPRRCSVYMSHSRTNDVANYRSSYGKNNTGTRDYQTNKVKTPEIPMGKAKTG